MQEEKTVVCPTCKKKTIYSPQNKFRPFCSERCHLLDLGAWADENFKIPVVQPENETDTETVNDKSDSENDYQ